MNKLFHGGYSLQQSVYRADIMIDGIKQLIIYVKSGPYKLVVRTLVESSILCCVDVSKLLTKETRGATKETRGVQQGTYLLCVCNNIVQ